MFEERLLERVRMFENDPMRRCINVQKLVIDSVILHLQNLLNTRLGNVPISEDYGVPDFLNFLQTHPESVSEIAEKIKNAIDCYEPRLTEANVTFITDENDELNLRFKIAASLAVEEGQKVCLETIVDTDGRVQIEA